GIPSSASARCQANTCEYTVSTRVPSRSKMSARAIAASVDGRRGVRRRAGGRLEAAADGSDSRPRYTTGESREVAAETRGVFPAGVCPTPWYGLVGAPRIGRRPHVCIETLAWASVPAAGVRFVGGGAGSGKHRSPATTG